MKRKFIFLFIIFILCVDILGNMPTIKANAQPATITSSIYSISIPESSDILSKGVISQGKPVYEITIEYTVTSNVNFSGNVINITHTSSPNLRLISSNMVSLNASGSNGNYSAVFYVIYHVWNLSSFVSNASFIGSTFSANNSITVTPGVAATYNNQFLITGYVTADENQYHGNYVNVTGLTGFYRSDFIAAVERNGSGRTASGQLIQYDKGTNSYHTITAIYGAAYVPVVAGQTIATDNYFIPRYYRADGHVECGRVNISSVGMRISEDAGGEIKEYMIDVYLGIGLPENQASWDRTFKSVVYINNVIR